MKFTLPIFLIAVTLNMSALCQEEVKGNLWLKHERFANNDRPASIYVKGNLEQIYANLKNVNGVYRHSYSGFHSVVVPGRRLNEFLNGGGVESFVIDGTEGFPLLNESKRNTRANEPIVYKGNKQDTYTGKGVVVGIIDSGIDFNHPDFQNDSGDTRIVKIWDQTRNQDSTLRPSFGYGEVYDSSSINNGNCPHVDPNSYHGHGTMVSGIAVGNGRSVHDSIADYSGYASESDILFVASDFGASNWTQTVADGIDWIFQEADRMGLPCVINLSIGGYLGSHDGNDLVSTYIDSLIKAKRGRAVVCAAGNAGHVPGFHLRAEVQNDSAFTWFKVNPNSGFGGPATFIELWGDTADLSNTDFKFSITDTSLWADTVLMLDHIKNRLDTLITINLPNGGQFFTWAETQAQAYRFQILVTKADASKYYKLGIHGSGKYDAWGATWLGTSDFVRDQLPSSQQYPEIGNYTMPDSLQSIVSGWNCRYPIISVGNYNNRADYENYEGGTTNSVDLPAGGIGATSSRGPARTGLIKPDVAAPGNTTLTAGRIVDLNYLKNTPSARYKLAKGGFHFSNGGTSMASPAVAGILARYLQKCPQATQEEMWKALTSTAFSDSLTGTTPGVRFGYGKVDAQAALTSSHVYDTLISSTGVDHFCHGEQISLSLKHANIHSIMEWSSGDTGQQVTLDTNNYLPFWKSTIQNQSGCTGYTDTLEVHSIPNPKISILGDSIFCLEDGDTLVAFTFDSVLHWSWSTGDSLQYIVIDSSGTYHLSGEDAYGCRGTDSIKVKGVLCYVSVEESLSSNQVSYFPNPTSDQLVIQGEVEIHSVIIRDIQGKQVYSSGFEELHVSLDLSKLNPGSYFVEVEQAHGLRQILKVKVVAR